MVSGKAEINQTLTLPVNMYFESEKQQFQEKKVHKMVNLSLFLVLLWRHQKVTNKLELFI